MIKQGTKVQHRLHEQTGTVIGYGMIGNPWSLKAKGVYLVKLDEPVSSGKYGHGPYCALSVSVWSAAQVQEVPEIIDPPVSLVDAIQHSRRSGDPKRPYSVPEGGQTEEPEGERSRPLRDRF